VQDQNRKLTKENLELIRQNPSCHQNAYTSAFFDYTVSQKNCAKLFLPELRQISTSFDNFRQKDGKEVIIMQGVLIFHLT